MNNLRAAPWKALALPLFLLVVRARGPPCGARTPTSCTRTGSRARSPRSRRASRSSSSSGARTSRSRGASRPLARRLVRRARVVVCASTALADDARALGARDVRVIPSGVAIPETVGEPDEPPHVLYVGRLSEEKGVRELAEAADGLPLVVVGDGPLRELVPAGASGFVPPDELGPYYERAAVVVVPSRREGYGVVAREAMAYGRPVVATAVGGLVDAVEDGVTGRPRPAGRRRRAPRRRSNGCSATPRCVRASARPASTQARRALRGRRGDRGAPRDVSTRSCDRASRRRGSGRACAARGARRAR